MAFFPFFVDLAGRRGLLVGGGRTAFEKLQKLVELEASISVVAPEILPEIAAARGVETHKRPVVESDVTEDLAFAIAATDDRETNSRVAAWCRERKVPVNVVDTPEESDFVFPAIVRRGPLIAAISTSGASPTAASSFKEQFAELIPDNVEAILDSLAELRETVKSRVSDREARKSIFKRLFEESVRNDRPLGAQEVDAIVADVLGSRDGNDATRVGRVALVGAGAGDASLITLRGAALLRRADVVLYDELIDKRLLDFAPGYAERLPVGKRCGEGAARQEHINALLVDRAKRGFNVVRLKGGDPYVFGRGGEEALALAEAKIPYEVVPGICSALYIPMEAGIPVSHRSVSRSVHIVAAHTSEDDLVENIRALAAIDGTIVFLMGLGVLEKIASELVAAGKPADTPAAVLSGGNSSARYEVRGTLADILQKTRDHGVKAPAVVVVGKTAALDLRSLL